MNQQSAVNQDLPIFNLTHLQLFWWFEKNKEKEKQTREIPLLTEVHKAAWLQHSEGILTLLHQGAVICKHEVNCNSAFILQNVPPIGADALGTKGATDILSDGQCRGAQNMASKGWVHTKVKGRL